MELDWDLNKPAVALKEYYGYVSEYARRKEENSLLESRLKAKKKELDSVDMELSTAKRDAESMEPYHKGDIDSQIQAVRDDAQKAIESKLQAFESQKREMTDGMDREIRANDEKYRIRISQLMGEGQDPDRELSVMEEKALEFETARRNYNAQSYARINQYEDAVTEEQLACQAEVSELKKNQDEIRSEFELEIARYNEIIDSINVRYQTDITTCENAVTRRNADRDEEIRELQYQKDREIQLANSEIEGYKKTYNQTQKEYNQQIRKAKAQNKPTTMTENSKTSKLNKINLEIQKTENRRNKRVSGIEQEIHDAQSKHAKLIDKAMDQLNAVLQERDEELREPTDMRDRLVGNRDSQVNDYQERINRREADSSEKINVFKSQIEAERQAQANFNANIDSQILEYVMSSGACLTDVQNEDSAPFMTLQERTSTWKELVSSILADKMDAKYPMEYDKQKALLMKKDYLSLRAEAAEAARYDDRISTIAKNSSKLMMAGMAVTGAGLALFLATLVLSTISAVFVAILLMIAGLALAGYTVMVKNKEVGRLCRYISLAVDYQAFPSLAAHSRQVTENRELSKMNELGNRLFDVHYGKADAKKEHDMRDADIRFDYERNVRLIETTFANDKAQIERDRDGKVREIENSAVEAEAKYNGEKNRAESEVYTLTIRSGELRSEVDELKKKIDENAQFTKEFDILYPLFEKKLDDEKWLASKSDTHDILNNSLYIIPENKDTDDYGHRKIYEVNHNKKALVVNYDKSDVPEDRVEKVNKIILELVTDFMYAVYRMNSRESYNQFVVDGMAAVNDLKKSKNIFNIRAVVADIGDIKSYIREFSNLKEELLTRNMTMDEVNERNYTSQDRPQRYNILYMIYKPNERKNSLEDALWRMLPDCDKYGFFPIFICEKETWEREVRERESMYKQIKGLANSEILVFNGKTYTTGF